MGQVEESKKIFLANNATDGQLRAVLLQKEPETVQHVAAQEILAEREEERRQELIRKIIALCDSIDNLRRIIYDSFDILKKSIENFSNESAKQTEKITNWTKYLTFATGGLMFFAACQVAVMLWK